MLTEFHIITITHNDLNVDEIGHFMVNHEGNEDLKLKLSNLREEFNIQELLYLNTCNRVTYICYDHHVWTLERTQDFFRKVNPALGKEQINKLPKFVRIYNGEDAINHLFEVASSIDSLVVGEREIFRQFREAYHKSKEFGLTGDNLRLLEKHTVQAAKEVYASTKIGEKPLSIVSLAMQKLLQQNLPRDCRILMVGAGETNLLMSKFLLKYGYTNAVIFNRNLNNADEISELLKAPAFHLTELRKYRKGFDVMIICTGATYALMDVHTYHQLLAKDDTQKLIIDLSVPRNVEEGVVKGFNVKYVDIEKLRNLAEKNLGYRKKEVIVAKKLLKKRLQDFSLVFQQRKIEKAMRLVPKEIKAIKQKAVEKVFVKELDTLDDKSKHLIMQMMDYMEKKCVSVPMKLAKNAVKS